MDLRGVHPCELSHDKSDLMNAQKILNAQHKIVLEEWQLGFDQWEAELEPLRLEVAQAAKERFIALWKSEHKRISAEARAMGLVSANKISAVLMRPWVNNTKELQFLAPGVIEGMDSAELGAWLEGHVTYNTYALDSGVGLLALSAAVELKELIKTAKWGTTFVSILVQFGHFPLGVLRTKEDTIKVFMNTDSKPNRTAFPRSGAGYLPTLGDDTAPNLVQMIKYEMCGSSKFKPQCGSMRLLYYVKHAFISFHDDATATSYDTPLRDQLAVAVPDDGEVAASEVVFTNNAGASGHHELGCPPGGSLQSIH